MDLLALDNAQPKLVGGSTSRRITGTVYATTLDASTSMVVGNTGLRSDRIKQASQTSDPGTLVAGDLWFRSDTGKIKYYDGSTTRELTDSSTSGIPNPGTKATNDILQYNGSSWDAVGAASGDRLSGTLYSGPLNIGGVVNFSADSTYDIGAPSAGRPLRLWVAYGIYQGDYQVLDASMSLSGDVTGAYTASTVGKIQNVSWLSGTPSDKQVATYDTGNARWEYQWPGIVNTAENQTFVILPAGSTGAQINAACSTYDVVYLKPGSYTIETNLTVTDCQLIGLDGETTGVFLTLDASNRQITATDAIIKNLRLYTASTRTADVIVASSGGSGLGSIFENLFINCSAASNYYAVNGLVRKMSHCYVQYMGVVSASTAWTYPYEGPTELSYLYGNGGDNGGYGINVTTDYVFVDNVRLADYAQGLRVTGNYCCVSNVQTYSCTAYGSVLSGSYGTYSGIFSRQDYAGMYVSVAYASVTNAYAYDSTTSVGVTFGYFQYSTASNIAAYSCVGGIQINGTGSLYVHNSTFSNLLGYACGGYGIYVLNTYRCSFTGLTGNYNRTGDGIIVSSPSESSFAGLTAYDNSQYGLNLSAGTGASYTSIDCCFNDSHGIFCYGYTYNASLAGIVVAYNGGSGVRWDSNYNQCCVVTGVSTRGNGGHGWFWGGTGAGSNYNQVNGVVAYGNTSGSLSGAAPANWNVINTYVA